MRYLFSSDVYTLLMITCVLGFIQAQCPDCGLNGNCVQTGTGECINDLNNFFL
jgi:hypothetical protein